MKHTLNLLLSTLIFSCGWRGEPNPAIQPALTQPPDSLVLSAASGVTIWFTEGRQGTDVAGNSCYERTLEIRRDTVRIKVPLLYTVTLPRLLDDSTLRAELARDCRPGDAYRVNLRTGQPTRIPAGQ